MRIVVVGGGIGGLALAQGLRRQGFDVVVVERDRDLARTGGYKLHLGPVALAALRELLPPALFELLLASAVGTQGFQLLVRDHRCRLLLRVSDGSVGTSLDVDRVTLRLVLAEGLESCLLTGRRATGYRVEVGGVVVELDGGEFLNADLVVLADGAGSKLAERLAGRPTARSTGLVGVAGRSPWADLPQATRDLLSEGPMLAFGPGGCGLFATAHDPAGNPAIAGQRNLASTGEPVAIWGLIATQDLLPADLKSVSSQQLFALSAGILNERRWSPVARALLDCSLVDSVGGYRLLAADPGHIAPWPTGLVTALGDAVHAVPPTGGQGAATAIRDAAVLAERLTAATRGQVTVRVAVHDYEQQMRGYAASAVRESVQPVGWILAMAKPAGRVLARAGLPVVAAGSAVVSRTWRRRREPTQSHQ